MRALSLLALLPSLVFASPGMGGSSGGSSGTSSAFTATTGSGNGLFLTQGVGVCFNNATCTSTINYNGTDMLFDVPTSKGFLWRVNSSNMMILTNGGALTTAGTITPGSHVYIPSASKLSLNGSTNTASLAYDASNMVLDVPSGKGYALKLNTATTLAIASTGAITATAGITSNAASTTNGFALATSGARIDVGAGANDYLYSDGTQINVAGGLYVNGTGNAFYVASGDTILGADLAMGQGIKRQTNNTSMPIRGKITDGAAAIGVKFGNDNTMTAGADRYIACFYKDQVTTQGLCVNTAGGLMFNMNSEAEPTCDSGSRGSLHFVRSGAGVADTFKVCSKDAADAYAWRALY